MDRIIDKKKGFKIKWLYLVIVLAGVAFVAFYTFGKSGSRLHVDAERLRIAQVARGEFQESIPLDGTVLPIRSIYLAVAEAGRVEERYVEDGQFVKAGTPLIRLSNPQLQLELMNREELLANEKTLLVNAGFSKDKSLLNLIEQLADSEFQLSQSARNWKQDSLLFRQGAESRNNFEKAQESYQYQVKKHQILKDKYQRELENSNAQIRQYAASVELKQKNLNLVRNTYEMLTITAPEDGQLSAFHVEVGEYKNKGENLGQLDIQKGYKIRASIDEHYLPRVNKGQIARFDFNGSTHQLQVEVIYPQVKNGRFEADLNFIQAVPSEMRKGQSIQLQLALGGSKPALQLPRSAYMQKSGGNWVYVLNPDSQTAERRSIRTGRQNTDSVEIIEGLSEGEQVIISSYDTFGESPTLVIKNEH